MTQSKPIQWFRNATPYINKHRGKVFVIMFSGDAVEHENFKHFIGDIALLNSLGIKLVLVHGTRPQIDANLHELNLQTPIVNNLRVTTKQALPAIVGAMGATRLRVEAQLTQGLADGDHNNRVDVVSGNYVLAKPIGVLDGVDFQYTGRVRSVDTRAIQANLANNQIVLLGSLGYSTTGEVFNLPAEQVAVKTAVALGADKLIFIGCQHTHASLQKVFEFTPIQIPELLATHTQLPLELKRHLDGGAKACNKGVNRTHIISYQNKDALLTELFSLDGAGTLVCEDVYEDIQQAQIEDVVGLIDLLAPLEEKGVLVKRSRTQLEQDIHNFYLVKRDETVIGCAALYADEVSKKAEIACVAVHKDYRGQERGEQLMAYLSLKAKKMGMQGLYVLTTQTAHWFIEQGFAPAGVNQLPLNKQQSYNKARASHVYIKAL